jgi:hypothetical protein
LRTNRNVWREFYSNYATGFITGANFHAVFTQGNINVGKNTSPDALSAAMELYCSQHPLEKVFYALASVYNELADKH